MWDSLGSTYVEAATKAFPVHRAFLFVFGVLLSIIAIDHQYKSLSESLINIPLEDFLSFDNGIFKVAIVLNVFLGVGTAFCGWLIARILLRVVFLYADRLSSIRKNVLFEYEKSPFKNVESISDRKEALEFIDSSLINPRSRIKSLAALAEMLAGGGAALTVGYWWGNGLDFLLGLVLMSVAAIVQFSSVLIFLSEYLGPAISRARLLGLPPPSPFGET